MEIQYDKFADIYDLDLGKQERDFNAYLNTFINNNSLLILGCGTGRETIFFSNYFDEVWGLDISEKMLNQAKKKSNYKSNIKYLKTNMCDFAINKKFDNIIIPNNGILHLLSIDEIENCLRTCKKHLNENGILVLDFFIPDYKSLAVLKSEKIHDFTQFDKITQKYITRERIHIRDTFNSLNYTQIFYEFTDIKGNTKKRICEYTIRYLFPTEFELLLKITGLKIVHKYGGFNNEHFNKTHRNIMYVIQKDNNL